MTSSGPVYRVVDLLNRSGYRAIKGDLRVETLSFHFAEVLVGTSNPLDLVVIVDTVTDTDESQIRRQVKALARALDMVASRRSLTLIIVRPSPTDSVIRDLSKVCRILLVGTPTGKDADDALRDTLAVLLPLDIPNEASGPVDPLATLQAVLGNSIDDTVMPFFRAAHESAEAVRTELKDWLGSAIREEVQ
jgi:hypothetical protein